MRAVWSMDMIVTDEVTLVYQPIEIELILTKLNQSGDELFKNGLRVKVHTINNKVPSTVKHEQMEFRALKSLMRSVEHLFNERLLNWTHLGFMNGTHTDRFVT